MNNNQNDNTTNNQTDDLKGVAAEMNIVDNGTDTNSGNKKSSVSTTVNFLRRVFHATDSNSFSYIFQMNQLEKKIGKTLFFKIENLNDMANAVSRFNEKPFGVSFSMGLTDKPVLSDKGYPKKASDSDIVAIPCLWCDIDIKSDVHAEENLFPNIEAVLSMIDSKLQPLGLYPNIIVNSGYGIHAYWIFDSPIVFKSNDDNRQLAESLLTNIQAVIRLCSKDSTIDDTADSKGYSIDPTADLSRIFRIPGSFNWKGDPDPESAPIAKVIRDDGKTFDVEDLTSKINFALDELQGVSGVPSPMSDRNTQAVEKKRSRRVSESLVSNGNFKLMIDNCAFIRYVVENFNTTPEPILKDALTNLLRASNARDYVIQLCKNRFGTKFNEDLTNERIAHYETQNPTTCKKIHETCNACILDDCIVFKLGKKVPAAIVTSNEVKSAIESLNKSLGDCVDDVPENLASFKIPFGYLVSDSGIQKVNNRDSATWSLCFVSKIYYEFDFVDGRKTFYQMTARINHRWDRFEVPAESIKDSRKVVETLSKCGVEIDSNVAKSAIAFFSNFNSINEDSIPHVHKFTKTGWNNDKFIIPREDFDFEVNAGTSTSYIYTKGSRVDSLNLILEARKNIFIRTMIDSALSATIIGKINCNNFVVNFWGRSGFGKTASFYLVNSLFADPRFIIDFNATPNALDLYFAERNDLPSFVNEFQLASSKIKAESAGDIIHRFESGETKKRLNEKSKSRPIKRFTSVMLTNAEQPITNPNVEGGKIRRTLEIHIDKPIPSALCKRFYSESKQNFGHIGLEFIRLFESGTITFDFARSKRDEFQTLIKELNPDAIDSHLDYISVITLVDFLFQIHFENVDEKTATKGALEFAEFLTQFAKSKSDLADSERAKSYIIDWRHIHEMKFLSTNTDNVKFIRDVYGYYLANSRIPLVIPSVLRKALLDGGFSPNKIFAEWHDEGVISFEKSSKQYSQKYRCNDGKIRRLTKLDFLNDDGDQTPSDGGDSNPSNDVDSMPHDNDDPTPSNDDSNPDDGYPPNEDPFSPNDDGNSNPSNNDDSTPSNGVLNLVGNLNPNKIFRSDGYPLD